MSVKRNLPQERGGIEDDTGETTIYWYIITDLLKPLGRVKEETGNYWESIRSLRESLYLSTACQG